MIRFQTYVLPNQEHLTIREEVRLNFVIFKEELRQCSIICKDTNKFGHNCTCQQSSTLTITWRPLLVLLEAIPIAHTHLCRIKEFLDNTLKLHTLINLCIFTCDQLSDLFLLNHYPWVLQNESPGQHSHHTLAIHHELSSFTWEIGLNAYFTILNMLSLGCKGVAAWDLQLGCLKRVLLMKWSVCPKLSPSC